MMENITDGKEIFKPEKWGLPLKSLEKVGLRLHETWERYKDVFRTKTRDTSEYAWIYLRGLLTLEKKRNYVNIAKNIEGVNSDGQKIQHFISDSPWNGKKVFERIQKEVSKEANFNGGMLTVDDSGDKRSSDKCAGAKRQYLGRLGKVDMGQVGIVIGYYKSMKWTLLGSELYFPEEWFTSKYKELRKHLHVPEEKKFKSKIDIALEMILNAKKNGVPFSSVGCDSYYGASNEFRRELAKNNIMYMAATKCFQKVYLTRPTVEWREPMRKCKQEKIMEIYSDYGAIKLGSLLCYTKLETVFVRHCERGILEYDCAKIPVFTVDKHGDVQQETILIRKEKNEKEKYTYAFTNAPETASLQELISLRCERFFVERTIQDCKEELGWDELEAMKYRAWSHHLALIGLALWFTCKMKLELCRHHPRDISLCQKLRVEQLPQISLPNIRSILQAIFPVLKASLMQTRRNIIDGLVKRARSTASRLHSLASG